MKKVTMFLIAFVLCGLMTNAQINLQNGLVAYFPFNGNANDESGNNLISNTFGNPSYLSGVSNECIDFVPGQIYQGSTEGQYILVNHSDLLNISNQLTISLWFNLNSTTPEYLNDHYTFVNKGSFAQTYGLHYHCNPDNGEKTIIFYHIGLTTDYTHFVWNDILENTWYNIVVKYDGNSLSFYVNGILKETVSNITGIIAANNEQLQIGANIYSSDPWYPYWLNGSLDEMRIYNRALNEQEIQALAGNYSLTTLNQTVKVGRTIEIPVSTSELIAGDNVIAYQFDFNYDNTKLEYVGNSLVGTLAEGGTLQVNPSTNKLSIAWASGTALVGTGEILKLQFKVLAVGETTPTITNALYNTESVTATNGTITAVYKYGDIDANDFVQAYDAALAIQYSVGLDPLPIIDPLPWENWRIVVADVDGVTNVTANDASEILKYTVGLITIFPVESGKKSGKTETADVNIILVNNELIFQSSGDLFGLNINVNENINVLGQPEFLNTNMLNATNINATIYAVGLATATSPAEGETFMKIPVTTNENVNVTFDMIVNTEVKSITVDVATGIVTINENAISLYPNPTNSILYVNGLQNANILIFDLSGKLLINKQNTDNQIDVSNLQNGIYTVKITNENGITTRKFVKQ